VLLYYPELFYFKTHSEKILRYRDINENIGVKYPWAMGPVRFPYREPDGKNLFAGNVGHPKTDAVSVTCQKIT